MFSPEITDITAPLPISILILPSFIFALMEKEHLKPVYPTL